MVGRATRSIAAGALCASVAAAGIGIDAAGGRSASSAAAERCHTSELSLLFVKYQGAAGTFFYGAALRNSSMHTCWVKGYPGVSLLGAHRHQIRRSARRTSDGKRIRRVTLRSRDSAVAKFSVTPGACKHRRTSRFLRVIPPDETDALTTRARVIACNLRVYPLR